MLGFKFNGVHSNGIGLIMRSKNRPILPEPKIVTEEIHSADGVYDFSSANPYGRIMYRQREISVDCNFISRSVPRLRSKAHEIASWLSCGEARLVFDDEPDVFYLAKVANRIDLNQQISDIGSFTIVFSCRPFAYSFVKSGDIHSYGNGLKYGDLVSYGGYNRFVITNNGVEPHLPLGDFVFNVRNFGTHVKPIIEFDGVFKNALITFDDKFLRLPQNASGFLYADCEKRKVVLNGMNITNHISGSFFELAPGDNIMSISGDDISCDLVFSFNYLYL